MIADRIKSLRESRSLTQVDLARKLGITRASVNAWEQGISVPSTQYIVELATIFGVSSDYLLNIDASATIKVNGLTEEDISIVYDLITHLQRKNQIETK